MPASNLILIADDQPHILMALEHLAKSVDDVTCLTAHDGPQAVRKAIERQPRLVVIATQMPIIDGHTAARMIRDQWQADRHDGQIWLTAGQLDENALEDAVSAGADQLLTHPFDPVCIVDTLRKLIEPAPAD